MDILASIISALITMLLNAGILDQATADKIASAFAAPIM